MDTILRAHNLSAGYGKVAVVRDIDIQVAPGEIVALLGANGVGKTTTLLTLAGEIRPLSGTVEWEGKVSHEGLYKRARRGLSLVTEERSVFMRLTVRENLRICHASVDRTVELFPELERGLDVKAGSLSGGEQQMLTVARALVRSPKVLLIDELSFGLAPIVVERILQAVRDAAVGQGIGVLLVEQALEKALRYSDRAYVMAKGSIQLSGTTEELWSQTAEIEESYLGQAFAAMEREQGMETSASELSESQSNTPRREDG